MRVLATLAEADFDQVVGDPLFGKREAGTPHIGAERRAIDDRARHVWVPLSIAENNAARLLGRGAPRNGRLGSRRFSSVRDAPLTAGILAGGAQRAVRLGLAAGLLAGVPEGRPIGVGGCVGR